MGLRHPVAFDSPRFLSVTSSLNGSWVCQCINACMHVYVHMFVYVCIKDLPKEQAFCYFYYGAQFLGVTLSEGVFERVCKYIDVFVGVY